MSNTATIDARITQLEAMLQARTDGEGNPRKGYKSNVAAIRQELTRLRAEAPPA